MICFIVFAFQWCCIRSSDRLFLTYPIVIHIHMHFDLCFSTTCFGSLVLPVSRFVPMMWNLESRFWNSENYELLFILHFRFITPGWRNFILIISFYENKLCVYVYTEYETEIILGDSDSSRHN